MFRFDAEKWDKKLQLDARLGCTDFWLVLLLRKVLGGRKLWFCLDIHLKRLFLLVIILAVVDLGERLWAHNLKR
jgi:hypothetical protein